MVRQCVSSDAFSGLYTLYVCTQCVHLHSVDVLTVRYHVHPTCLFGLLVQADGGTRCACINAAMLALADAGIPLKDMVASCAAGFLDDTPLLDLNYLEDSGGGPDVAVALHPNLGKIVLLQMDSRVAIDTFETVLALAEEGSKAVAQFMRQRLREHTQQLALARGDAY